MRKLSFSLCFCGILGALALRIPHAQALELGEQNGFMVNSDKAVKMWLQQDFKGHWLHITTNNETAKAYIKEWNAKAKTGQLVALPVSQISAQMNPHNKLERLLYFLASRGLVKSIKITGHRDGGGPLSLPEVVHLGMDNGARIENFTLKDSRVITREGIDKENLVYFPNETYPGRDVCVKISFVEELIKANRSEYASLLEEKAKNGMICESDLPIEQINKTSLGTQTKQSQPNESNDGGKYEKFH